ncbi:MAG: cation diffusion facilitator family transporter [Betaproteobacteria bacterium]
MIQSGMTPYQALWLSIGAALATIALKWSAAWVTGSVGFLSDALESVVNLLGASFALAMVVYARKPADPGHPFGHGKAEYFASAFEGGLIALAAAGILYAAGARIAHPEPLHTLGLGTALSVAAALVNLAVARVLLRVGRAHRSLATEADGRHLMTDVWTTAGVIVGVGLAGWTGWYWLDPVVAILVAFNILREGGRLVWRSFHGLMDAALADEDIREITAALAQLESPDAVFANLRTRRAGADRFAFVELHVPAGWSVERADKLARTAEHAASDQGIALAVRLVPAGSSLRS